MSDTDLAAAVARAVDQAALGASAPALLLEAQAQLGRLADRAGLITNRGVRPFRPDGEWARRLAELAFTIYNLADQTGVELDGAVRIVAADHERAVATQRQPEAGWPFTG